MTPGDDERRPGQGDAHVEKVTTATDTLSVRPTSEMAGHDPADAPLPWGGRQLVVPVDGPLAGRWYFSDDWQVARSAAEHTAASRAVAGHPPADVLGYVETGERVDHPDEPAVGAAWRFLGATPVTAVAAGDLAARVAQ